MPITIKISSMILYNSVIVLLDTITLLIISTIIHERHTAYNTLKTTLLKYSLIPILIIFLRINNLMTWAINKTKIEIIKDQLGVAPNLNAK